MRVSETAATSVLARRLPRGPWEARPPELAYLLNPAFCAVLLRAGARAHVAEMRRGLPLALAYVLLPVVLHKSTRDTLPATTRTRMLTWLATSPATRLGVADRIRSVAPYARETLLFAVRHDALTVDGDARLLPTRRRLRAYAPVEGSDAAACLRGADLLGRWFARAGDPATVLAAWGIQL